MLKILYTYLLSLPVLVGLDLVWLGVLMTNFYKSRLGEILAPTFRLWPSVGFYLIYAAGLLYFVALPAFEKGSLSIAILNGALYGFVVYSLYNLINQATLVKWSYTVLLVDTAWGVFLGGIMGFVAYKLLQFFT
ncbi:DUF2177 family protein [Candidatus Parcubacteria bacterium]|nr:DUF2177 family protein [Candidatus Parcubacteria bacterium]